MLVKTFGAALQGIDAIVITIEVAVSRGYTYSIVGLPDTAIKESNERVRSAMRESGFEFPRRTVVVNLAPADVRKEGSAYDLPIAIGVLTAAEDHGWTGSVATFAKEKAEEINGEGTYTAEVITANYAADQITKLENIVASCEKAIAVVIQPMDDTLQSAIQQLVDAGIPYVAFDRIIDAVSASAVSNVKGDNEGIGAGAAEYFVSLGMKPGEAVYVYEGDTLPEDYVCPICKHGASDFEPLA